MFSEGQQREIENKVKLLKKLKTGEITLKDLARLSTEKRTAWLKENKESVLAKYTNLPDEEKAFRIIYFDYMNINPEHCVFKRISDGKIRIDSHNFCPYLEACKQLGLDTKTICKQIGEPSIQKMCHLINPKLKFRRNYENIRPHCDFCEEYFEIFN